MESKNTVKIELELSELGFESLLNRIMKEQIKSSVYGTGILEKAYKSFVENGMWQGVVAERVQRTSGFAPTGQMQSPRQEYKYALANELPGNGNFNVIAKSYKMDSFTSSRPLEMGYVVLEVIPGSAPLVRARWNGECWDLLTVQGKRQEASV
mgnify:CR=1 FL=1